MSRRTVHLPHRTTTEWGVRIACAFIAAILGYFALTQSLAQVLRSKSPARAHALAPYDGRIAASLAAELSGVKANAAQRVQADRLARLALRKDPTAILAFTTLGMNAQMRGDTEAARDYFALSDRLSRRNLMTRLWLIEDAVARDDIPTALRNYDIALRTSRSAPDLLYPILASAITDSAIRRELVQTLAVEPAWTQGFIEYVAGNGKSPWATASLFYALRRAGVPVSDNAKAGVINKLIADGKYDAAWGYYASIRGGVDRRYSRDPQFSLTLAVPSAFDWVPLGGTSGVWTVIQSDVETGMFSFSAPSSVGGPLLQQMQVMSPGVYQLEGRSIGVDQPESMQPYWVLICLDGRQLGRVVLPNSSESGGLFRGRFTVPSGCLFQNLQLIAPPSNASGGLSGQIDEVSLRPLN